MLTCKDGRLQQLNQFVDLDQHLDGHFELDAVLVRSVSSSDNGRGAYKICSKLYACSYACASRHREKVATAL